MPRTKQKFSKKLAGSNVSLDAAEYERFKKAVVKFNESAPVKASLNDIWRMLAREFAEGQLGK